VQAGAAFQAREGERWRNGIVFGEVDLSSREVALQPWQWVPDHQNWALAATAYPESRRRGDWWLYSLPGTPQGISQPIAATPPRGWEIVRRNALKEH
jgi:hypothetical protein